MKLEECKRGKEVAGVVGSSETECRTQEDSLIHSL